MTSSSKLISQSEQNVFLPDPKMLPHAEAPTCPGLSHPLEPHFQAESLLLLHNLEKMQYGAVQEQQQSLLLFKAYIQMIFLGGCASLGNFPLFLVLVTPIQEIGSVTAPKAGKHRQQYKHYQDLTLLQCMKKKVLRPS